MTFAIAAAGTGGHVFPGLAVGEALVRRGIERSEVLYVGGVRLEASVYPDHGFPFLPLHLQGLVRGASLSNFKLPVVVGRAAAEVRKQLHRRQAKVLLGMGGYVTVPAVLGARWAGAQSAVAEQNAEAGLANRLMARLSEASFSSFPDTAGLPRARWVGNPIRRGIAAFDRAQLRPDAMERWGLDPGIPVLGVFGGSLGAGVLNSVVAEMMAEPVEWQVVHLAGRGAAEAGEQARVSANRWVVLDFCDDMNLFFSACDLVVARAGGSVAELTATATPAVLVPGGFGSAGHQRANARSLADAGAAVVVGEQEIERLPAVIAGLLGDPDRLQKMSESGAAIAKPDAADDVAAALIEMAGR